MHYLTSALLSSLMTLSLPAQGSITIHAKIIDWRGRPAAGSTVSLIAIKNIDDRLSSGLHREYQVTAKDGCIDLEAPAGWWQLDITRKRTKRGFPATERFGYWVAPANSFVDLVPGPPIFEMRIRNSLTAPRIFQLGEPEWDDERDPDVSPIDMTTSTQGQTFRMDETRAIQLR
jgi:hypothetical protein